jgi:hypothetical protein
MDKKSGVAGFILLSVLGFIGSTSCYAPGAEGGETGGGAAVGVSAKSTIPVSAGTIEVTGSGMAPISANLGPGESTKSFEVPSGKARTVTLSLTGSTVKLSGSATVDLLPGQTKTITLKPTVTSSKIIIPDKQNSRIVQIDLMDGTGWKEIGAPSLDPTTGPADFFPFPSDFDAGGRVYFANDSSTGNFLKGILRIPDIDHPADFEEVLSSAAYSLAGFVIDRQSNTLYFVREDGPGLWRLQLDGGSVPSLVPDSDTEWNSAAYPNFVANPMAIDARGRIYIADVGNDHKILARIDLSRPVGSRILVFDPTAYSGAVDFSLQGRIQDIIVIGETLYVLYPYSGLSGGKAVVSFDTDLNPLSTFGDVVSIPSGVGDFAFPFFFPRLVGEGKTVYVMDDPSSGGYDRIISFDSMTGLNWKSYGSSGSGQGQFLFVQTP